MSMQITSLFVAELDREAARSRRALESVPDGKSEWKPHEKSMQFGYLANMVATMPMWITMMLGQDDRAAAEAKQVLRDTSEAHLNTPWRLLAGGKVVSEHPRHEMIRDTINHWAHHSGQMTVYLRLMGAKVPALYGPSADDTRFD